MAAQHLKSQRGSLSSSLNRLIEGCSQRSRWYDQIGGTAAGAAVLWTTTCPACGFSPLQEGLFIPGRPLIMLAG
jgi:hypothetical protein